jgi:rhodanese-related sulfurtransferase
MARTEDLEGVRLDVFTPEEVKAMHDRGDIVLIDVRTPNEYVFEHIPGALLFPMQGFDADKLPTQETKRMVFHCGSGMRSKAMADRARKAGIDRLAHMEGGFGAWKQAGLPYVTVDPATGNTVTKP